MTCNYTLKHGYTWLIIIGGRIELLPHVYVTPCFLICYFMFFFDMWKLKVVIIGHVFNVQPISDSKNLKANLWSLWKEMQQKHFTSKFNTSMIFMLCKDTILKRFGCVWYMRPQCWFCNWYNTNVGFAPSVDQFFHGCYFYMKYYTYIVLVFMRICWCDGVKMILY
jgi:hypothetical protein